MLKSMCIFVFANWRLLCSKCSRFNESYRCNFRPIVICRMEDGLWLPDSLMLIRKTGLNPVDRTGMIKLQWDQPPVHQQTVT